MEAKSSVLAAQNNKKKKITGCVQSGDRNSLMGTVVQGRQSAWSCLWSPPFYAHVLLSGCVSLKRSLGEILLFFWETQKKKFSLKGDKVVMVGSLLSNIVIVPSFLSPTTLRAY